MTKEPQQPYGYVLVLRGLAKAAIELAGRPASLRVLCVLADYMNQDGICRFGQGTVAARLGMTRQAVNKHLRVLDEAGILTKTITGDAGTSDATKAGRTLLYMLNIAGMKEARAGQDEVDIRRFEKRARKEGLVEFGEREGIATYREHMTPDKALIGDSKAALDAMTRAEAAMGVRYEVDADALEETGIRYYRRIQIPPTRAQELTQPVSLSEPPASGPAPASDYADFG
jgi:DNA-binding transcriptional ArsR family regulator